METEVTTETSPEHAESEVETESVPFLFEIRKDADLREVTAAVSEVLRVMGATTPYPAVVARSHIRPGAIVRLRSGSFGGGSGGVAWTVERLEGDTAHIVRDSYLGLLVRETIQAIALERV